MNTIIRLNVIVTIVVMSISANAVIVKNPYNKNVLLDSSRVYDIDEIIIVSQPKESLRLRVQPASSTSFSSDDIQKLGIRDIRDLSAYTPSFTMPNYGSRLTSSMYIRGIGSRINSPAVGIYADGIPIINKSAFNFYTYQLDRVDILRGPQGTLYGQNTEGGLVRMYSKNPIKYQGTDIKLSVGSRFMRNVEMSHYAKLNERLAISAAGFYNGQNGFLYNQETGERADLLNEAGGKVRVVYHPTSRLSFDFITDYQYVRQNGFAYGFLDKNTGATSSPSSNNQSGYIRNMLNSGLTIGMKTKRFDLSSTTTYQYLKDCMMMDQDYTPIDYMHLTQRQFQNALTEELAIKNNHNKLWHWTFGAIASYQWLRTSAPISFGDGITKPMASGIQLAMYNSIVAGIAKRMMENMGMSEDAAMAAAKVHVEEKGGVSVDNISMVVPGIFHTPIFNTGAFHESNIKLTERLTSTIGLRYDFSRVEINYDTKAAMELTAFVMGIADTRTLSSRLLHDEHSDFSQILPKLGFNYRLDKNNSNIYVVLSKGYRAGGYNMQMFSDILQTELINNSKNVMYGSYEIPHTSDDYAKISKTIAYKPETSWNYEIGAHINMLENSIHMDISAYCMNITNQQLSVMAGNYGFGRMMVNAGKSQSLGFEASLRGRAIGNRMLWGISYGFTHAVFKKYKDYVTIDGEKVLFNYRNKRVPYVPSNTFSTNASYRFDMHGGLLRSLTFGLNMTAQGRTYWNEGNTYYQPIYAVLDAKINGDMGFAAISLWCRNITNTEYNTFAINSSATGKERYFAQRGYPIQLGIDVSLHF